MSRVSKHDERVGHLFKVVFGILFFFSSQLALLQCKTEMLLYIVAFFYWLSRMLKSPGYGKGIF